MAFLKWLSPFGNGHGLWALACDASGRRGEWPNAKRPSYRGASGRRSGSGLRAGEREYGPLSGAELGVAIKRAAMGAPAGSPSFAGLARAGRRTGHPEDRRRALPGQDRCSPSPRGQDLRGQEFTRTRPPAVSTGRCDSDLDAPASTLTVAECAPTFAEYSPTLQTTFAASPPTSAPTFARCSPAFAAGYHHPWR